MSTYRFATRNFLGKIVRCYTVEANELKNESTPTKARIGHHIMVVDASGSMYGDIGDIKEKIRKMLTLDEYRDSAMLVSLFSYASNGDLVEHFTRVPVGDIVKSKNTKAQREIGSLRSRGMTCMTQAFEAALKLAKEGEKPGELTAVSLHTDGFFNDPSPSAEFRKIDTLIEEFKKLKGTYVNTIGYRDWCDFGILGKIANALSGKCWQAKDIKTFYDSIYDTTQLLNGQTAPALCLEKGNFDYQVFVSSDGKVAGSAGELNINGVKGDASKTLYLFKEIAEKEFAKNKAADLPGPAMCAFAKSQLAEGRVNAAKYAFVSTRLGATLQKHAKALASKDLAEFSSDLDLLIHGTMPTIATSKTYGLDTSAIAVPALLSILAEFRDDYVLDFDDFIKSYQRRGLKRLTGKWEGDRLLKPAVYTELRDKEQYLPVSSFEFNRNNATINMMIKQRCKLLKVKGAVEIKELGGIKLDLADHKQYTIVGDGTVNVPSLKVRITNKRLFGKLEEAGVVSGTYNPKTVVELNLSNRPLVEYDASFEIKKHLVERLATLHTADKLFGALIKEAAAELSDKQVEELKANYITPNLYVSMPSTNPYTDLKKALSDGEVDTRLSYKVIVGNKDMIDPTDLYSANEFLRRWYECSSSKDDKAEWLKDPKKVVMPDWFRSDFKIKHKVLSAKVKVGSVDKLMAEVFDEFFGLSKTDNLGKMCAGGLEVAGLGKKLKDVISRKVVGDKAVEILTDVRKAVGKALGNLYREEVSPLVFYVGSSGLIPDDFGEVSALTPERLIEKYPDVSLGSKQMKEEGAFYPLDDGMILTVLIGAEYFSTQKGIEKVKEIEKGAVAALG